MNTADIILTSNAVFTGLDNSPSPAAIAIVGNKIAHIGTRQEIEHWIGPNTKQFHYRDQLIMAGFHDFHLHVMLGSLFKDFSVSLFEAKSELEAVEMVEQYANAKPEDYWVIGCGWDKDSWDNTEYPHRSSLDRVLPDRPALLFSAECHYAWVNSKALELINVSRDTVAPPFGIIDKDENGEPTGILHESAMSLAADHAFNFSDKRVEEMLENFFIQAGKVGVTSVHDLFASRAMKKISRYELFKRFEDQDRMSARIHIVPALDGDLETAKALRETYKSGKLQFSGLKQFIDGVVSGHTAYMLDPYIDKPESRGEPAFPEETIKQWVVDADREGFRIRFHTIGDAAIRLGLDAFEEAQKQNGIRDSRHTLEHLEVVHPEDIPRFKQLGVIASMQPYHLALMPVCSYTARIGEEKSKRIFPVKSIKETGAKIVFGSDYPVAPLNPMLEIHRAVTRLEYSEEGVWNEAERIRLADALRHYTVDPAYGAFREHEMGTLEKGKLADIVVLDRNLFEVPSEQIRDARVHLTIMDGKIVFES